MKYNLINCDIKLVSYSSTNISLLKQKLAGITGIEKRAMFTGTVASTLLNTLITIYVHFVDCYRG